MEMQNGQDQRGFGAVERLEARVQGLLQTNTDRQFRAYLQDLAARIARQKYQTELLEQELERQCGAYQAETLRNAGTWRTQGSVPPQYGAAAPQPAQSVDFRPEDGAEQAVRALPAVRLPQEKRSAEFVVGAALSIVGGIFVLIALLLLGMYLMNGFVKGMLLYAACLAVMLVSELTLYRRWRGMGETFSAIAMGGLYITTLVNYFSLGNFNRWVCLAVTAVITAGIVFLSRKRDAAAYRILGIAACYLSMVLLPATKDGTAWLLTFTGVLFLMNLMCVLVPVRTHGEAISITHLALHTLGSLIVFWKWANGGDFSYTGDVWPVMIWVAAALLTEQMIFVAQIRSKYARKGEDGREPFRIVMCIAYGIAIPFYALIAFLGAGCWADVSVSFLVTGKILPTAIITVPCACALVALRGRRERWFPYYLFCVLMLAVHIEDVTVHPYYYVGCLLVVWILTNVMTFTKDLFAIVWNAVVTGYACIFLLWTRGETRSLLLLAGLAVSILCINRFRTYFSTVLTFTGALYAAYYMLPSLQLPVFVGILFLGMLLFNHVERWKDKGILVYNILVLLGQTVCFLLLLNPVYRNAYLTYFCMLVFGISTIVVCFQPKYHLDFGGRELIAAIFLTYMALIVKTNYDIINSILMMVIALVSVMVGFASRKKSVRIYGLVLSLLVCVKIILYDFLGVQMLQKTILFFTVGMIAIVISVIYMVLEKQMQKKTMQDEDRGTSI